MIKTFIIFFLLLGINFAQGSDSIPNSFHTKENIIQFANYLFCEKDYLRAADEYLKINEELRTDEINFRIAFSFSAIGEYSKAENLFSKVEPISPFSQKARLELLKILFLEERYLELREKTQENNKMKMLENTSAENKLLFYSYLKEGEKIPAFDEFIKPFDFVDREELTYLYQLRINPPNKNPLLASILSSVFPGAGKFYTEEISDGIFAFITTGLFSFLAYDNFKARHNFRGWLFAGLAAGFYGGNVYGSYTSAQIYNSRIRYELNLRLDSFVRSRNYFLSEYDLCK